MRFIVVAVLFTLSYSTWTVLFAIDPHLDVLHSFVSEYAVWGRPGAVLIRVGDAVAGVLLVVLGVFLRRRHALSLMLCAGLVVAGVATVGDTLLSYECAPSLSEACATAEVEGTVGLAHQLHSVTSALVGFGFAVAVIADIVMMVRSGRSFASLPVVLNVALLVLLGVSGVLALIPHVGWAGAVQRLSLVLICAWVIVLSVRHARMRGETLRSQHVDA
ncbi:DUF998 domain-containing protein [Brevibacterium sp. ACRRH]|uniref:DUF998 domain-containing protein n=1 Tax=Brevibacterium sp. ACRRH TaxID=2918183 RepID=UPI001EF5DBFF|nr:DUF998 domain-containing protein [uncultured Brevibacterium sp.]MCG7298834.1 DUF998 domain-containing protein [Brevibacterium sp. ACRRH]